jgi:hypothetical protein
MLKFKQIASRFRDTTGAEIAEAALVLPVAFMFLLGIIWFGRAYNIYSTIQQAAQQGALAASRDTCATCTNGNVPPSTAAADNAIYAVMHADNLDVTPMQLPGSAPTCGTTACGACPSPPWPVQTPSPAPPDGACAPVSGAKGGKFYVCQNVLIDPAASSPQCGTVVSFQYPYQFYLPFTSVNMQAFKLSAQAQSRMEN